jgi:hypothetical protein
MTCNNYNTQLKGINNIAQDLLLNALETNLKSLFDWGFLQIGGWFNATIPNSGTIYGGTTPRYKLVLTDDPSYTAGKVWQGIRKDWVWETGACYGSGNPINISGVYVNNTFIPTTSGTYHINYPMGRVVFNNAISKTANVTVNHSYRYVQVYRATDAPWFNVLQYDTFNNANPDIKQISSGEWAIGGNHRVQMPAIVISRSRPYEIGNDNLLLEQDIALYVFAENKNDRNKILDIIRLQQDLHFILYDTNAVAQNDKFPLDENGNIKNNALMYPELVAQYPWRKCWLKNISLFELEAVTPSLFRGMARCTAEIIST